MPVDSESIETPPETLRKREAALLAAALIATGQTTPQVAAAVGVDPTTLKRWRRSRWFRARVIRHRDELVAQGFGRLLDTFDRAVGSLRALVDDPDPKVRLAAARAVTGLLLRYRDVELAERLAVLEGRTSE